MSDNSTEPTTHLTYVNVALAFSFIAFDAILSFTFKLGVGRSLLVAAVRCVLQLTVVGTILKSVFETENPWGVVGYALLLNLLGTFETGAVILVWRLGCILTLLSVITSGQQIQETI